MSYYVLYRPDLVDWRKVHNQTNVDNLKMAFDTAEIHYGVTPLLDPEGLYLLYVTGVTCLSTI